MSLVLNEEEELLVAAAQEYSHSSGEGSTSSDLLSPAEFKLGEMFTSFEHFKRRLEEHQNATNTFYSMWDSKLLSWFLKPGKPSRMVAHAKPELKYYNFISGCVRGLKNRSKSKNIRNKLSQKIDCPAFYQVKMTKDGQHLVLYKMISKHNHGTGPEAGKKETTQTLKMKVVLHDGFLYRRIVKKQGGITLKCQMQKCKGEAVEDGDKIVLVTPHNHGQSEESEKLEQSILAMEQRASTEATTVAQILTEERRENPDVINAKNESYLLQILSKTKKDTEPPVPNSLLSLSKLLVSDSLRMRYGCNLEDFPRELFIGCIKAKNNEEVAAVFASLFLCERFNGSVDEMHIDCSYTDFSDVPEDMKYLLSIHFVKNKLFYPSVFAFMSSKSLSMVDGLMRYLQQEVLQNLAPDVIYIDFKWGIQLILNDRFPGSLIENSFIYFCRDVWQQAQEIGLLSLDDNREYTIKWTQQLVCLPFLPADTISLGINVFEDDLPKDYLSTPFFTILLQYIRDTWVDESGATSITIHDHPGRSNLLVNQFHSQLKEAFSQAGTTVWHLINCLQKLEMQSSKCYSREISDEPATIATLSNLCQMAYDEKVKKIEYDLLTETMSLLTGLDRLSQRIVIQRLTPELITSDTFVVAMEEEVD